MMHEISSGNETVISNAEGSRVNLEHEYQPMLIGIDIEAEDSGKKILEKSMQNVIRQTAA